MSYTKSVSAINSSKKDETMPHIAENQAFFNTQYIKYVSETGSKTCEYCHSMNGHIILADENELPFHPNCRCHGQEINKIIIDPIILKNINNSIYFANADNIFPSEEGRSWNIIVINDNITIYYSGDLAFITGWEGKDLLQLSMTSEFRNAVSSLQIKYYNEILKYYASDISKISGTINPYKSEGEYLFVKTADGNEYKVNLNTLNGMGVLPDGQIVIGYGKKDPEYYVKLMDLKNEYVDALHNKSLDSVKIAMSAFTLITEKYPNLNGYEQIKIHQENWMNIPDDYYKINDATNKIDKMLSNFDNDKTISETKDKLLINRIIDFYNISNSGSTLDLKSQNEWYHQLYIYDNEIVDQDALGNILYGWMSKKMNISEFWTIIGADFAQKSDNKNIATSDDSRDNYRINQGIEIYESSH